MGAAVKQTNARTQSPFSVQNKRPRKSPIDRAKGYELVWNQVSGLFEAVRQFDDVCFVYLIGEPDDGPLKIGKAKDPIQRLRDMQTGNSRRLRIEYVMVGTMVLEKQLHRYWEPFAIASARNAGKPDVAPGTEWFKPEARETLLPIAADAVRRQIEFINSEQGDIEFPDIERIALDAHAEAGFVVREPDQIRLLAANAGYVVRRSSPPRS